MCFQRLKLQYIISQLLPQALILNITSARSVTMDYKPSTHTKQLEHSIIHDGITSIELCHSHEFITIYTITSICSFVNTLLTWAKLFKFLEAEFAIKCKVHLLQCCKLPVYHSFNFVTSNIIRC